jgi:hypothetical protein
MSSYFYKAGNTYLFLLLIVLGVEAQNTKLSKKDKAKEEQNLFMRNASREMRHLSTVELSITDSLVPFHIGEPSIAELQMKSYEKDTTANAFKMLDYGKFIYGEKFRVIRYQKYKLLKKSSYAYATIKIPFYAPHNPEDSFANNDEIEIKYGHVYNLEEGVIKMDTLQKGDIFIEDSGKGWKELRFTLPNIKEGSIFEIEYIHHFAYGKHFNQWAFQDEIPTAWSECKFIYFNENISFKIYPQNIQPFFIKEESEKVDFFKRKQKAYRWVMKSVPLITKEPYIESLDNFKEKVEFELGFVYGGTQSLHLETWEDVATILPTLETFGKGIKGSNELNSIARDIKMYEKDSLKQIKKAHDYIKKIFIWNGQESMFISQNLKKLDENKVGNSSDMNLNLVALLRLMKFDANPVILSTNTNVNTYKQPFLGKMDYTIAHVLIGGKDVLLDATEPFGSFGVLPIRCLNGKGYLISSKNSRWINLLPSQPMSKSINVSTQIVANVGEQIGTVTFSGSGYYPNYLRETLKQLTPDKFKKNLISIHHELQESQIEFKNCEYETIESPEIICKIASNEGIQVASNRLYFNLFFINDHKQNSFSSPTRKLPIDFKVPMIDNYSGSYQLPVDYEVEEMPKSIFISSLKNKLSYEIIVKQEGDKILINSKLVIQDPVFQVEDYSTLREFYQQVVAKQAEKIVLKKK